VAISDKLIRQPRTTWNSLWPFAIAAIVVLLLADLSMRVPTISDHVSAAWQAMMDAIANHAAIKQVYSQPPQPESDRTADEASLWESVQKSNDPTQYRTYLNVYPTGRHAELAQMRIDGLACSQDCTPIRDAAKEYDHAIALMRNRQYLDAEQALKSFLKRFPDSPVVSSAEFWLGEVLLVRGRYDEAATVFANGRQKYPNTYRSADMLAQLGVAYVRLGRVTEACRTFDRFSREVPTPSPFAKKQIENGRRLAACQ
jgi:tol-pal system protein YbgF